MMQDTLTEQRVFIFDLDASASLEMIQIGLDALAELPPAVRAQFAWGEQYLRRHKAVLEARLPFSEWPAR